MGSRIVVVILMATLLLPLHSTSVSLPLTGEGGVSAKDSTLDILMMGNSYTSSNSLSVRLDSMLIDLSLIHI